MTRSYTKTAPEIRFWKKVTKTETCWLFDKAYQNMYGYGQFWDGNKLVGAHVFSWILHFGLIPKGLYVLHECDTPSCIRPSHLFLGTQADNITDMFLKDRRHYKSGLDSPTAKLFKSTLDEIISILATNISHREIGRRYKLSHTTIDDIANGKRHVREE